MNEQIKNYISNYLRNVEKWEEKDLTEKNIIEYITEEDPVYEEHIGESRWWTNVFRVVKIGDIFFGFFWAKANRDESIFELGWEFNSNSIVECEEVEVTIKKYVVKK